MNEREAKEPIKIYLDDKEEPFKVAHPPLRFSFSTIQLADGAHTLRVEASNGLAPPTTKEIPFRVRNGVAVTVSGLEPGQTIGGQVELIVNAYAGNTEVDFEPRRAETPQPIPTWAWVILLGITAWTLFYVFNPARPPRDASATTFQIGRSLGERLYMDTCARCHGEGGEGRLAPGGDGNYVVKKLRDTPNLAVDETPYKLLFKVVTGTRSASDVRMPAWGPRLTNEEIVAVVNFVRSSWGHDASKIEPTYRRPPQGIDVLEENIVDAMTNKSVDALAACCWPEGVRPQLYRIDGPRWAIGKADVLDEWRGYFEALGKGEILDFQLTDVRYAFEPEGVSEVGAHVFAMGRIFLSTKTADGTNESDTGRFIRVYRRVEAADAAVSPGKQWALIFDFASIRMRVGCATDDGAADPGSSEPCPPGEDGTGAAPTPMPAAVPSYAEVQAIFAKLGKEPGDAPHDRFWTLPHKEFVALQFPFSWDDPATEVPMLVPGDSKASNLIKAISEDRPNILVKLPDGTEKRVTISRMPKGGSPMAPADIARLAAWIDAGCLEFAPADGGGGPPKDGVSPPQAPGDGMSKGDPAPEDAPPREGPVKAGAIGYKDVQDIFAALGKDPGDAPHARFWTLPHREFVELAFPFSWDDPEIEVKLIEPWNAAESNLICALRDGRGVVIRMSDGRTMKKNIARMPKGATPVSDADIQRIADWIDAGCPAEAGGSSPWPRPGTTPAADPVPAERETPIAAPVDEPAADAPPGEPALVPAPPVPPTSPAPAKPALSALGFDDICTLIRKLRHKAPSAPHGNFWKELTYGEFVSFAFPEAPGKEGRIRLVVPYDSAASNMMKAFRDGKGLVVEYPDGHTVTRDIAPMPKDADPIPADVLAKIAVWIDAGCPEVGGQPSALPRSGVSVPDVQVPPVAPVPAPPAGGFPEPAPAK